MYTYCTLSICQAQNSNRVGWQLKTTDKNLELLWLVVEIFRQMREKWFLRLPRSTKGSNISLLYIVIAYLIL